MKKFSCYLIALGVCAGAFGAHILKDSVTLERLEIFKTGVFYQISMSILLLILVNQQSIPRTICYVLSLGIIVFSGTLYVLVLFNIPFLGAITPIGGILIIVSILLAANKMKE